MSIPVWLAAFNRFAIAADAVGMWSLASSLTHIDICLRLAEEARARKLPLGFGILYDELCRKQWAEAARAGVAGFSVDTACLGIDRDIVSRAEALQSQRMAPTKPAPQQGKAQVCFVY